MLLLISRVAYTIHNGTLETYIWPEVVVVLSLNVLKS